MKRTPKEIDLLIAERIRGIRRGGRYHRKVKRKIGCKPGVCETVRKIWEISLISLTKIAMALELEGELEELFAEAPFLSIEEIINEKN